MCVDDLITSLGQLRGQLLDKKWASTDLQSLVGGIDASYL